MIAYQGPHMHVVILDHFVCIRLLAQSSGIDALRLFRFLILLHLVMRYWVQPIQKSRIVLDHKLTDGQDCDRRNALRIFRVRYT
jgi:hypothetical protein